MGHARALLALDRAAQITAGNQIAAKKLSVREAESLVKKLGGTALDAVNKTLTYLVVGDKKTPEKSTKQKAAEKLVGQGIGIQVITESAFLEMAKAAEANRAGDTREAIAEEAVPVGGQRALFDS
jgi:BRCT domain type II-containing protein